MTPSFAGDARRTAWPAPPFPVGPWPGTFKSVSAGTDHACAIRAADDTILCWGAVSMARSPPGPSSDRFKSISDRCGVRFDDKVVCWGDNARGEAPPGPSADSFQSVSHVCGCAWMGGWSAGATTATGARPRDLRATASRASAPRAAGLVVACGSTTRWSAGETTRTARRPPDRRPTRSRVFQRVPRLPAACAPTGGWSAGETTPTARRLPGRRPTCSRASAPASMATTTVSSAACAPTTGWSAGGTTAAGQAPPLPRQESFKSVSAGGRTVCAIRADDKLVCWADDASNGQAPPGPSADPSRASAPLSS